MNSYIYKYTNSYKYILHILHIYFIHFTYMLCYAMLSHFSPVPLCVTP